MMTDEIMKELWKIKDEIAVECDYDINKLFAECKKLQAELPNTIIAEGAIQQYQQTELSNAANSS